MTSCIFLPGIIAPAVIRYAPLFAELDGVDALTKELEVYTLSPPANYSIGTEVEGLARCADRAGLERFHLYAHSGGGAVALAFTATHPERVLSLAVDEPAFDFSDEMAAELQPFHDLEPLLLDNPQEAMARFLAMELADGVDAKPPPGPPPLPNRPAGIAALLRAFASAPIDHDALRNFEGPVLYTRGALSTPLYERSAKRLAEVFRNFEEVVFEDLHHLNTSHQAEPARVASLLRELWERA
jgi:pimeloyl-ACP methyl ester carboxylesterase